MSSAMRPQHQFVLQIAVAELFLHNIRLENLKPVKRYEADGEGGGKGKDHREGGGQPEHFGIWDHDIDNDNNNDDLCDIDFDDDGNIFKS